MQKEIKLITEPAELLDFVKQKEEKMELTKEDAQLLLDYLEGHDYRVGTDKEGEFYCVDIGSPDNEAEVYSMDELIDTVCEWNFELIQHTKEQLDGMSIEDTGDKELEEKLGYLQEQEKVLDKLYEQTKYHVMIDHLALSVSMIFLEEMKEKGTDQAVENICDRISSVNEIGGRGGR